MIVNNDILLKLCIGKPGVDGINYLPFLTITQLSGPL